MTANRTKMLRAALAILAGAFFFRVNAEAAWCIQSQPGNPMGEEWLSQMWPEDEAWCLSQGTYWSADDAPPEWALGQYDGWCPALQAQSDVGACYAADPSYATNAWQGPAGAGAWYALLEAWVPPSSPPWGVTIEELLEDVLVGASLVVGLAALHLLYSSVRRVTA